jgi:hypothetical protein
MTDLSNSLRPQIWIILTDPKNWSEKNVPTACAACGREFNEHEVPLILWTNDGLWSICFHLECAFEGVTSEEDSFAED